jgi:hypothetical protein
LSGPFISHSSRDNFEALAVRDWFVSRGGRSTMCSSTWTALVPARAEAKANERCEAVVFLICPNSLTSNECYVEPGSTLRGVGA